MIIGTPAELPCDVKMFRAAIRYGVQHGLADPKRIGIIGFSATCEEVLAALETAGMHFAAAELVDGLMGTYSQYIDGMDVAQGYPDAFEAARFAGAPIGSSLNGWVSQSPGFSVNKIRSPLMIQSNGREGLLAMWEPYAILRYLHRPVDLISIQKGTHPFSNPRQQYASLRLTLDWFRFWLQSRRPASTAEYRRWYRMSVLEAPVSAAFPAVTRRRGGRGAG